MLNLDFQDLIENTGRLQRWIQANAAFLGTPAGREFWTRMQGVKQRYQENENWWNSYGRKNNLAGRYNASKEKLKGSFQNIRQGFNTSPANPSPFTGPGPAGGAPAPAPMAAALAPAAASAAPPVYLPNVNAPQYMFPSAENVRDMTYNPGIGGFLRPNQWQPGVPSFSATTDGPTAPSTYGPGRCGC